MNHPATLSIPQIDTFRSMGLSRLTVRLLRRIRYCWVYPWAGRYLFPLSSAESDGRPARVRFAEFEDSANARKRGTGRLLEEAENLCRRRVSFLNLPAMDLGNPVNWLLAPESDPLWQENLHYGRWASVLAEAFLLTHETRFRDSLLELLEDWVKNNPIGRGPGWEPYPMCRRMAAWVRVGILLQGDFAWGKFWRACLLPVLYQQAGFLSANLEKDLANNHLVANYRALSLMGLLFPHEPEAARWRSLGLVGLWSEMRRQVLPDGVHDERSVSYHTAVLQDLLETWDMAQEMGEPIPEEVVPTLFRMVEFLAQTQAPDGTWPAVNDSIPQDPGDPGSVLHTGAILLTHAGRERGGGSPGTQPVEGEDLPTEPEDPRDLRELAVFMDSGYAVLRDKALNYLFFDAGPMGPRRTPGHGHADALSFILYGGGQPLIVDPGVFSYHDHYWRNYFRSTRAHNTVTVDNQDQCVFWGTFRVAYPAEARLLEWSKDHLLGEHKGYGRLSHPVFHQRRIQKTGFREWELSDHFTGRGEHEFALTLQFAPKGRAEVQGLNCEVQWPGGVALKVICRQPPARATAGIESGWVSPTWHLKEEAPRYVLRWRSKVPDQNLLILKITPER